MKKHNRFARALALLLSFLMAFDTQTVTAFAAAQENPDVQQIAEAQVSADDAASDEVNTAGEEDADAVSENAADESEDAEPVPMAPNADEIELVGASESLGYTYYIVYEGNDSDSGNMSQQTVNKKPFTLTKNKYSKTGYTFDKWLVTAVNTYDEDGNPVPVTDDAKATAAMENASGYADWAEIADSLTATPGATVILQAQWKANRYNAVVNAVTVDGNSSSNLTLADIEVNDTAVDSYTVSFDYDEANKIIPAATTTKPGYVFVGYTQTYTGYDGSAKALSGNNGDGYTLDTTMVDTADVSKQVLLTAKFATVKYEITFETPNGDEGGTFASEWTSVHENNKVSNVTVESGTISAPAVTAGTPETREFAGWRIKTGDTTGGFLDVKDFPTFTMRDIFTNKADADPDVNEKVTLVAEYRNTTYTVKFMDGTTVIAQKKDAIGENTLAGILNGKGGKLGYTLTWESEGGVDITTQVTGATTLTQLLTNGGGTYNANTDDDATTVVISANYAAKNTYNITVTGLGENKSISGAGPTTNIATEIATELAAIHGKSLSDFTITTPSSGTVVTENLAVTAVTVADILKKIGDDSENNITINCEFTPYHYTVVFAGEGGKKATVSLLPTATIEEAIAAANATAMDEVTSSKTGYTATGWTIGGTTYSDDEGNLGTTLVAVLTAASITDEDNAELTFTADWDENSYTLRYDANGAISGSVTNPTVYNYTDDVTIAEQGTLAKTGYNFKGWSTVRGGAVAYTAGQEKSKLATGAAGDTVVTLYAVWEPATYTIRLRKNISDENLAVSDGSDPSEYLEVTKTYGEALTLNGVHYTCTGYEFSGWNRLATGTGTNYAADGTIDYDYANTQGAVVDLYANWTPITYTIHFEKNSDEIGGGDAPGDIVLGYDAATDLDIGSMSSPTAAFLYWCDSADGTGNIYEAGERHSRLSAQNGAIVRLYAIWNPITYTVTYNGNGGTTSGEDYMPVETIQTSSGKVTFSANKYTRTGYTFAGWKVSKIKYPSGYTQVISSETVYNAGQEYNVVLTDVENATVTMSAQWTPITYDLVFNINGADAGSYEEMENVAYDDKTVVLPNGAALTYYGYEFLGWSTDQNATEAEYSVENGCKFLNGVNAPNLKNEQLEGTDRDVTLYAVWSEKTYEVTVKKSAEDGNGTIGTVNAKATDSVASVVTALSGEHAEDLKKAGHVLKLTSSIGGTYTKNSDKTFRAMMQDASNSSVEDITLTESWDAITYTVEFSTGVANNAGVTGTMENMVVEYGASVAGVKNLTTNAYHRPGYKFAGWKIGKVTGTEASSAEVWADSDVDNAMTAGTIKDTRGDNNVNNIADEANLYSVGNANELTQLDYNGIVITLEAQWTGIEYTIHYQKDGSDDAVTGEAPENQTRQYGAETNNVLRTNTFEKTGYVFKHWKIVSAVDNESDELDTAKYLTTNDTTSPLTDGATLTPNASAPADGTELTWIEEDGAVITLQAVFEPATYVIKFDGNGGEVDESKENVIIKYTGNNPAVQVSDDGITRKGYTFDTFKTAATGDACVEITADTDIDLKTLLTDQSKTYEDLHVVTEGNVNYITLYAQWTENQYDIIFDPNQTGSYGGVEYVNEVKIGDTKVSAEIGNIEKLTGKDYTETWNVPAVTYTRVGYELVGWAVGTNSDGNADNNHVNNPVGGFVAKDATGVSISAITGAALVDDTAPKTVTLYAVWKPVSYTVKYDKGDSTGKTILGTMQDQTVNFGKPTELRANAYTAKGYLFDGWKVTEVKVGDAAQDLAVLGLSDKTFAFNENTIAANDSLVSIDGATVTLSAQWKAVDVEIGFVRTEEEDALPANTISDVDFSDSITMKPASTFDVTGKTVTAWIIDGKKYELDTNYAISDFVTNQMINAAEYDSETNTKTVKVKAVAKWDVNKYSLVFDKNAPAGKTAEDVDGTMATRTVSHGDAVELPENTYALEDYLFKGWNTEPNGSGTSYADGATIPGEVVTGDITLYAVWKAEPTYTIEFNKNADDADEGDDSIQGFNWVPKDLDVEPDQLLNDENHESIKSGTQIKIAALIEKELFKNANAYTRKGYDFECWNTKADLSGNDIFESEESFTVAGKFDADQIVPSNDETAITLTLYAKWKERSYTVSYDGNGGTGSTDATAATLYTGSVDLTANGFTKTGYHFIGWATSNAANATKVYEDEDNVPVKTLVAGHETESGITLYAVWEANTYKVSYDANGGTGTGTVADLTVTYDEASAAEPIELYDNTDKKFKRIGYNFKGWATTRGAGTEDPEYLGTELKDDLTTENNATVPVYAVWEAYSYTVHYDLNGADDTSIRQDRIVKFDETFNVGAKHDGDSDAVTRVGYQFTGWKTAVGESFYDGEEVSNLTMKDGATVTIIAQWTPITYTISYNEGQGTVTGTAPANTVATYGEEVDLADNTFERTGYDFVGWATSADAAADAVLADSLPADAALTSTQGATVPVYAIWAPKKVNLTFNANGGTGADVTQEVTRTVEADLKTMSVIDFTKTGYHFTGWNTQEDGNGTPYADGASITVSATEAAPVLYAQWEANTYTITYHANGGEEKDPLTTSAATYDSAVAFTNVVYTRTGYSFKGWAGTTDATDVYADNDAEHPLNLTTADHGQVDVYAVWTALDTKVTFKANGGVGGTENSGEYVQTGFLQDVPQALTGNDTIHFTRRGYTFKGWSTVKDAPVIDMNANAAIADKENYTVSATELAADGAVLYAVWAANSYTVHFANNNADVTVKNSAPADVTVKYDELVTLPDADDYYEHSGYTFEGWGAAVDTAADAVYDNDVAGREAKNLKTENGDEVTVYAIWTAQNTKVTFKANGGEGGTDGEYVQTGFLQDVPKALAGNDTIGFTRTGYTFKGWTTDSSAAAAEIDMDDNAAIANSADYAVSATELAAGGAVLYAVWAVNTYKVKYDVNQGNGSIEAASVKYDAASFTIDANSDGKVKRVGYEFLGWALDKDAKDPVYSAESENLAVSDVKAFFGTTNPADVTLYAVWAPINYTVVFVKNADDVTGEMEDLKVEFDKSFTLPENEYHRTGYQFTGWSTNASAGTNDIKYADKAEITTNLLTKAEKVYFYAQWEALPYTITFDVQGGNGTFDGIDTTFDSEVVLPTVVTREGYQFQGWSRTANAVKADFAITEDALVVNPVGEFNAGAEVKLYAVWGHTTYKVTIYANSAEEESPLAEDAEAVPATTIATILGDVRAVRKYYTFLGWSDVATDTEAKFTTKDTIGTVADAITSDDETGEIVLYAIWKIDSYTITYKQNASKTDAVGLTSDEFNYNATVTLIKTAAEASFVNPGSTLTSWNTKADGTGVSYKPGAEVPATELFGVEPDNVTLYAIWSDSLYTIDYDKNEDALAALASAAGATAPTITGSMKQQKDVTKAEKLSENQFVAKGYEVIGWTTDGTDAVINITDEDDDTVLDLIKAAGDRADYKLRATWGYTNYTITFHGITFADGKVINGKSIANNKLIYNLSESVVLPTVDNVYTLSGIDPNKYEFLGFYTDSAFKIPVENIGKDGEVKQGNVDVYAKLSPKTYTITFRASAEEGAVTNTQNVYFGSDAVLSEVTYTKAGYVHAGWSTTAFSESAPGSLAYALRDTISAAQIDALYAANPNGLTLYPYYANSSTQFVVKLRVAKGDEILSDSFTREGTMDGYDVYTGVYNYGTGMTLPAPKTAEGQTFIGWYDENGKPVTSITKTDARSFTLTARYKITTYTVTFNYNAPNYVNALNGRQTKSKVSGKVTAILLEHTAAGSIQSLGTPALTAKGFTLRGWSKKPVASLAEYNEDEELQGIMLSPNYYCGPVTANMTLYAVWSMDVHTLTIVDPLGDEEDDIELPLTIEGIASLTGTLENLELLSGFDHDSSYTLSGFATTMTGKATNKVKSGYVTDLKLYARYAGTYNITLHDGLESDAVKILKNRKLQSIGALPGNSFKNPGHVFIGWSDSEGGAVEDVIFADKQVLTIEQVCERLAENEDGVNNIDLYAVWADLTDTDSLTFKVNFMVDGEAGEALSADYSDVTYTYGTADLDVRTYTAVKPGYTFKGWFTQPVGGKQVKKIGKKSVGDITLYARFTGNKVSIVYDAESGNTPIFGAVPKTKNATRKVQRDKVVTVAKVSGKVAGYTFVGWSPVDQTEALTVADLGAMSVAEYRNAHGLYEAGAKISFTDIEDAMLAQDIITERGAMITLHAVWLKNEYSYNFETQGAVVNTNGLEDAEVIGGTIKYTYTADQSTILPEATKPGYTFQGWGIVKVTTNNKTGATTVKYTKGKIKKFQTKDTSTIIYPIFKLNK